MIREVHKFMNQKIAQTLKRITISLLILLQIITAVLFINQTIPNLRDKALFVEVREFKN